MIGSVKPHSLNVFSVLPPSYPQEDEMTISAPILSSVLSNLHFSGSMRPFPLQRKKELMPLHHQYQEILFFYNLSFIFVKNS